MRWMALSSARLCLAFLLQGALVTAIQYQYTQQRATPEEDQLVQRVLQTTSENDAAVPQLDVEEVKEMIRAEQLFKKEYDLADLPFDSDLGTSYPEAEELDTFPFQKKYGTAWPVKKIWGEFGNAKKEKAEFELLRSNQRPFLWVHIHKAGGTFMCVMAGLAGEKIVSPSDGACNWVFHDQYTDSGNPDVLVSCEKRAAHFAGKNYTWGELERELKPSDMCWDDFDYGVMLREPLSLIHSETNYHPFCPVIGWPCGGGPKNPAKFVRHLKESLASNGTLTAKGNDQYPLWKFYDNIQTRLLADALDVPFGQLNETHVEAAKEVLKKFKLVVRLEDLPLVAPKVFKTLGWNADMKSHIGKPVNANSKSQKSEYSFSDDEVDFLRDLNGYDIALYDSYGV